MSCGQDGRVKFLHGYQYTIAKTHRLSGGSSNIVFAFYLQLKFEQWTESFERIVQAYNFSIHYPSRNAEVDQRKSTHLSIEQNDVA